ncbi:MAG: hypothetical protein ABL994_16640, partial [Verrucomicrobiales bacterium]
MKTLFLTTLLILNSGLSPTARGTAEPKCHPLVVAAGKAIGYERIAGTSESRMDRVGAMVSAMTEIHPHFVKTVEVFLQLDPTTQLAIADTLAQYDSLPRVALLHRLRVLTAIGDEARVRRLLVSIPHLEDRPYLRGKSISEQPDLAASVLSARAGLPGTSDAVFEHILGEEEISGIDGLPQMKGGGHKHESWEQLAAGRLVNLPANQRAAFEARMNHLVPGPESRQEQIDFFRSMGFEFPDGGWTEEFSALEQLLWSLEPKHNGAMAIWLPYEQFRPKAWKNTELSARHGSSPIGAKSLFPVAWDLDRIRGAVVQVLSDPNARVLRRTTKNNQPAFYLAAEVDGVAMEVGINQGRVGTAFPSWRQQPPRNWLLAYRQWHYAFGEMESTAILVNRAAVIPTDLTSIAQLVPLYFGENAPGLPVDESQKLHVWLSPKLI